MIEQPKRQGFPVWIIAVGIPAVGALLLCCVGGVGVVAWRWGASAPPAPQQDAPVAKAPPQKDGPVAKAPDAEAGDMIVDSDTKPVVTKIQVAATRAWQDAGVKLVDGSKVAIVYKGTWSKGALTCSGSGFSGADNPRNEIVQQLEKRKAQLSEEYRDVQNNKNVKPATPKGFSAQQIREREEKMVDLRKRVAETKQSIKEENDRWTATLAKAFPSRPVISAPPLCLVLKVGADGEPMPVPGRQPLRVARGGRLFFQTNDTALDGNAGSLEVEVTVVSPPPPKWVGDVKVEVLSAGPASVSRKDFGAWKADNMLLVKLKLTNASPTKIIIFGGWHGKATLSDEHGNTYRAIDFGPGLRGFGDMPAGPADPEDAGSDTTAILARNLSLHPSKSYITYLFFEPPAPVSKEARLAMPANELGGTGTLRVRVDMSK